MLLVGVSEGHISPCWALNLVDCLEAAAARLIGRALLLEAAVASMATLDESGGFFSALAV